MQYTYAQEKLSIQAPAFDRLAVTKILHGSVFNIAFAALIATLMFAVPVIVAVRILFQEI